MSLNGRSLCSAKEIFVRAARPKRLFTHHGMPARFADTPRAPNQHNPLGEGTSSQIVPRHLFTPLGSELLEQDPDHLVQFLNDESSAARNLPTIARDDVVSAYLAVRETPSSLADLRAHAYARISKHVGTEGLQQVMAALAEDVLTHFPRHSDPNGFSESILAILSHATSACPLSNQRVLQLCEALVVSNDATPPPLDADVVQRVASAASNRPRAPIPPLDILGSSLLSSELQTEEQRTKSTQLAYELLMKLMMEGEESYPRALSLFQDLVKANRIPKQAQERASEEGGSFRTIVTTALVRACLWLNWRENAIRLLLESLRNPHWPHVEGMTAKDVKVIADLALEVLRIILPTTRVDIVRVCRTLIMALLPVASNDPTTSRPPPVEIPQEILFSFYDSCYACRTIAPAAHVYHHTQSPQIRQYHEYPPPRHSALFWLLDHFASPGTSMIEERRRDLEGRTYIARVMLEDIILNNYPVPLMDRPRLVSLAASRGWREHARQLWEMYTAQDDINRDVVRSSAHMLVPLVKLFIKSQVILDSAKGKDKASTNESKNDISVHGEEPPDPFGEFWQFAERVLGSYLETKEPVASATAHDLNALARAQFLLGKLPESLESLTHVLERRETTGIMDINVVLLALARYSPRRATEMMQKMVDRGVQPTASTFSAVLHEALREDDGKIVRRLISGAHELGYGALTRKGMASLVRSSMTFKFTPDRAERLRQQQNVRWALNTVETIMRNRKRTTTFNDHNKDHAISVSVGFNCVKGSLNALQPRMAYRFWWLLVRDRVPWDTREHKDLRAWIAREIRFEWRKRRLKSNGAAKILEELRAPGLEADGPRLGIRLAQ